MTTKCTCGSKIINKGKKQDVFKVIMGKSLIVFIYTDHCLVHILFSNAYKMYDNILSK